MNANKLTTLFDNTNKHLSLYRFTLPFQKAINFNGHQLKQRQGLWLVQQSQTGQYTLGEIAPLPGFSHETLTECEGYLLALLRNSTIDRQSLSALKKLPSIQFALHCLLQNIPWKTTSNSTHDQQKTWLLQGNPAAIIQRYEALNCPTLVKLKVARLAIQTEIQLFKELIHRNPAIRFKLDANQQWDNSSYCFFLQNIDSHYIDYIEEPTRSMADNIAIAKQFNCAIALDESLLALPTIPIDNSIKTLVLKPTLLGDPQRIDYLLNHAQQNKLQVMMSASFESPLALNQLRHLAEQWRKQTQLNIGLGLDTQHAFTQAIQDKKVNTQSQFKAYLKDAERLW